MKSYLQNQNFLKYLKLCVLFHTVIIDPIKIMVSNDLLSNTEHEQFRVTLQNIFEVMMDSNNLVLEEIQAVVPEEFRFAFRFKTLDISEIEMSNEYIDILDTIKTSVSKRYLSQPLDDIHSFYNNINLERIFAMTKRNKDMAPNKEIYTRTQQIKARMNKIMSYLKEEGLIQKILKSELTKKGVWLKEKFLEHLKWNAAERMKRLEGIEQEIKSKKSKINSKIYVNELLLGNVLEFDKLKIALSNVPIKSDRERVLKNQIQKLRASGLKFGNDRPWVNSKMNTEEILFAKIYHLHDIEI